MLVCVYVEDHYYRITFCATLFFMYTKTNSIQFNSIGTLQETKAMSNSLQLANPINVHVLSPIN